MANILEGGFLSGKKTYIVMFTAIIGAVGAYLTGDLSIIEAGTAILAALGLGGLRDAIKKIIP